MSLSTTVIGRFGRHQSGLLYYVIRPTPQKNSFLVMGSQVCHMLHKLRNLNRRYHINYVTSSVTNNHLSSFRTAWRSVVGLPKPPTVHYFHYWREETVTILLLFLCYGRYHSHV